MRFFRNSILERLVTIVFVPAGRWVGGSVSFFL